MTDKKYNREIGCIFLIILIYFMGGGCCEKDFSVGIGIAVYNVCRTYDFSVDF